jgi:hypothetical protein
MKKAKKERKTKRKRRRKRRKREAARDWGRGYKKLKCGDDLLTVVNRERYGEVRGSKGRGDKCLFLGLTRKKGP